MNVIEEVLLGIAAVIIFALGLVVFFQHETISNLNDKVTLLTTENGQCLSANENWRLQTDMQNKFIAKMKDDTVQRALDAEKAIKAAETTRQGNNQHAASILSQKVDADDCTGAKQVLSTYLNRSHP